MRMFLSTKFNSTYCGGINLKFNNCTRNSTFSPQLLKFYRQNLEATINKTINPNVGYKTIFQDVKKKAVRQ